MAKRLSVPVDLPDGTPIGVWLPSPSWWLDTVGQAAGNVQHCNLVCPFCSDHQGFRLGRAEQEKVERWAEHHDAGHRRADDREQPRPDTTTGEQLALF